MEDPDSLEKLIESVADGTLDRERLPRTHRNPSISRLLAELQLLAGVSEVHRAETAADDSAPVSVSPSGGSTTASASAHPAAPGIAAVPGPAIGDKWGNFELLRKIGEGAFGEVYLARDLWLGHDVALKILRATVADRTKLLDEARMLVRVRHPHVVTVHGADVHNGRLGFWMDFVDGVTLHEAIARDGRRSAGEAIAWGQDLCRALAAVHGAGIVHRDVKAQNVMRRSSDGQLILMDFGAGEMLDAPRLGEAAGTPLYLAPELLDGAAATRSSDIYALGVLLFYVVSRQFPVHAPTWEKLILAHAQGTRARVVDIRPDLPPAFVDVVERALARDPSARYSSAGEMLAGLRDAAGTGQMRALRAVPSLAPPSAPSPPAPSPLLRLAGRAAAVVVGLLTLTFAIGFIACVFFESALNIDPDFATGPADYLRVGQQALLPFVLVWIASAAVAGVMNALGHLLHSPLDRLRRGLKLPALTAFDPSILGAALLTAGVLACVAIVVRFYPVYVAQQSLLTAPLTPATIGLFEPIGANTTHGLLSAILSFLLGLAVWKWFPWLEQHPRSGPAIQSLRWATLGIAFLVVALSVIPRRLVWDEFEIVMYENQRAIVIGERGSELLLYVPESRATPIRRVGAKATGLERSGSRGKMFVKPT